MIAYASRTGTRRNLAALRAAGWRLMVSARGVLRTEGVRYALDNGAWTAHQRREPFDVPAFEVALDRLGDGADFVVAPDIVAGGLKSLDFSVSWMDRLAPYTKVLIPVQDGMTPSDVAGIVSPSVGLFLGGSTEWKLATMLSWGERCCRWGVLFHVGRVNSSRRISMCAAASADSFDGSSVSRYAVTLNRLNNARMQPDLLAV